MTENGLHAQELGDGAFATVRCGGSCGGAVEQRAGARAYSHGLLRHFAEATATILVKVAERMQSLWTALHTTSALVCARGEARNVSSV